MQTYEYLEAAMITAFSLSWYWSIHKMLKTKKAAGKSPTFVVLICSGYLLGIASKLLLWRDTGTLSPLIWLYVWNFLVTTFDLALVLYYARPNDAATSMQRPVQRAAIAPKKSAKPRPRRRRKSRRAKSA